MQSTTDDEIDLTSDNSNEDEEYLPSHYAYLKIPPALLSLVCSVCVIRHVHLMSRTTTTTVTSNGSNTGMPVSTSSNGSSIRSSDRTYQRFLFGLCLFDILSSCMLLLDPIVHRPSSSTSPSNNPIEPTHWYCQTSGYLKVTGVTCGSAYNAALATFFAVTICRGQNHNSRRLQRQSSSSFSSRRRRRRPQLFWTVELPWHAFVLAVIALWTSGLWLQVYNPLGGNNDCWPGTYPSKCTLQRHINNKNDDDEVILCTRGDPYGYIYDWVTTIGFCVTVTILLTANGAILYKVRKQERRNQQYASSMLQFTTNNAIPTDTAAAAAAQENGNSHNALVQQEEENSSPNSNSKNNSKRFSAIMRQLSNISNNNNQTQQQQSQSSSSSRQQQVAVQSFLYCGGYLAVYGTLFVHTLATGGLQHYDKPWYPLVRGLQEITFPLQGFLNALVYFRPRYGQWRAWQRKVHRLATTTAVAASADATTAALPGSSNNNNNTKWQALCLTLSTRELPTPGEMRRFRSQLSGPLATAPVRNGQPPQPSSSPPLFQNNASQNAWQGNVVVDDAGEEEDDDNGSDSNDLANNDTAARWTRESVNHDPEDP